MKPVIRWVRYYLSNSVLELNEAAYLLGFVDRNSFGRAFRAWEGVPLGLRALDGEEGDVLSPRDQRLRLLVPKKLCQPS